MKAFTIMHNDDSLFIVATVPPPPGESDAYSAATKLQGPPLAMIAAMMDNVVDLQLGTVSAAATEIEQIEPIEEVEVVEQIEQVEEIVDAVHDDVAVDVDFTEIAVVAAPLRRRRPASQLQPLAIVLASIATIAGGAIAAISFLV